MLDNWFECLRKVLFFRAGDNPSFYNGGSLLCENKNRIRNWSQNKFNTSIGPPIKTLDQKVSLSSQNVFEFRLREIWPVLLSNGRHSDSRVFPFSTFSHKIQINFAFPDNPLYLSQISWRILEYRGRSKHYNIMLKYTRTSNPLLFGLVLKNGPTSSKLPS